MTHSFTYIDIGGNQARYSVSEEDHRREFHWSTDHGDRGVAPTFALAESAARTTIKTTWPPTAGAKRLCGGLVFFELASALT